MKCRISFVTNSSSTNFIIINKTNENKNLSEFVEENIERICMVINKEVSDYIGVKYGEISDTAWSQIVKELSKGLEGEIIPSNDSLRLFNDGRVIIYYLKDIEVGESDTFKWYIEDN